MEPSKLTNIREAKAELPKLIEGLNDQIITVVEIHGLLSRLSGGELFHLLMEDGSSDFLATLKTIEDRFFALSKMFGELREDLERRRDLHREEQRQRCKRLKADGDPPP